MKTNKKILIFLTGVLLLAGCQKKNQSDEYVIVEPLRKGDYGYLLPYESNSTSVIHNKYQSNKKDTYFMGEQALELAKSYFDPGSVYVREGNVLESNELERFDANYRGLGLLKFKTDYNPEGLNPEKGNYVPSGSGVDMYNAILVSDVYETDFVNENGEYVGFQFTIVLNETVSYRDAKKNADGSVATDSNGNVILEGESKSMKLSDDQLYNYGSIEAGQRLVSYLRNNHPEVGNLPIHVLLYKTTSSGSKTSGVFIGQSYVTNRSSTSYDRIRQEWVFAPSDRLSTLNSVLAGQMTAVKNAMFEHFPNEVGYYGRVFFQNDLVSKVEIEISLIGKTYVEVQSLIQYMATQAPTISENKTELSIHIKSDGEIMAIIHRDFGSNDVVVTLG